MAHANKYELQNDFTSSVAANKAPVDALALNEEFTALSETVNKVIDNQKLLQRDDGKPKDKSITLNALDDELRKAFDAKDANGFDAIASSLSTLLITGLSGSSSAIGSLSTSTSSALSVNLSVNASLITSFSTSTSTSLSASGGLLGSLSTSTSSALSGLLSATNSNTTSLSASLSNGLSTTNSSTRSLSTVLSSTSSVVSSLSVGLSATVSALASLSTATSSGLSGSISGVNSSIKSLSTSTSTALSSIAVATTSLKPGTIVYYASKPSSLAGFLPLSITAPTLIDTAVYPQLAGTFDAPATETLVVVDLSKVTDNDHIASLTGAKAFDGSLAQDTNCWHSGNTSTPKRVRVHFPSGAKTISKVLYQQRTGASAHYGSSLQLQGSPDGGTTWVNIGSPVTLTSVSESTVTLNLSTSERGSYSDYAIYTTTTGYVTVGEIYLYEPIFAAGTTIEVPKQSNIPAGFRPYIFTGA